MIPVRTRRPSTVRAIAAVSSLILLYLVVIAWAIALGAIVIDLLGHLGHVILGF